MVVEALKIKVLIWGLFMSTTTKAAIHLGPNSVENLEVHRNTNFKEIQDFFVIAQKLLLDHQAEILNVTPVDWTAPSWTRSTLSRDRVITRTKARVRVFSDPVLCLEKLSDYLQAYQRWKNQIEEFRQSNSH